VAELHHVPFRYVVYTPGLLPSRAPHPSSFRSNFGRPG
jgi:hypothetical protein